MLSAPLREFLRDWSLVTERDLNRCRRRVRMLSKDLPPFDSVWLDALVQNGKLTPWQADVLDVDPELLCIGPYLLQKPVEKSRAESGFVATDKQQGTWHLKQLRIRVDEVDRRLREIDELCTVRHQLRSDVIVMPQTVAVADNRGADSGVHVVSRYVDGEDLRDRLVRRGRFPSQVVETIACEVIRGLAELEAVGLTHGAIRLEHIRLTDSGGVHLVEPLLHSLLEPTVLVDDHTRLQHATGVAPERFGTGQGTDSRSDMYSLGTLFWTLLAGRAPFLSGDPVRLLAAQQRQALPDLRQFAPETSERLVLLIESLTQRDRNLRPESFGQLTRIWKPTRKRARTLKRFRSAPVSGFGGSPQPERGNVRYIGAGVAVAGALLIAALTADRISWPTWTDSAIADGDHLPSAQASVKNGESATLRDAEIEASSSQRPKLAPLPAADHDGIVHLDGGQEYLASKLPAADEITIQSDGEPATIFVGDDPLALQARNISLRNINVRSHADDEAKSSTLVVCQSMRLTVENCQLAGSNDRPRIGIAWRSLDEQDRSQSQLSFDRVTWSGFLTGNYLAHTPSACTIRNSLKLGDGPLLRYANAPLSGRDSAINLQHLTLRDCGPLLRITPTSEHRGRVPVDAKGCVFHLRTDDTPLIEFITGALPEHATASITIAGEDSLTSAPLLVGSWRPSTRMGAMPLADDAISIEGLIASPFEFASSVTSDDSTLWSASVLDSFQAPLLSSTRPGVLDRE